MQDNRIDLLLELHRNTNARVTEVSADVKILVDKLNSVEKDNAKQKGIILGIGALGGVIVGIVKHFMGWVN